MAVVRRIDNIGTKTLLALGEFGLDMSGSDDGRLYVGTGTVNVSVAKQSEFLAILAMLGSNNGIAQLDGSGLVPSTQLPSYVDDVEEVATYADLPVTGEDNKIYVVVADETNGGDTSTYRWTGTVYAMVSNTLTAADIEALYEGLANTNKYTDLEKLKLAITETNVQLDTRDVANRSTDNHVNGSVNSVYTILERDKLGAVDQGLATTDDVIFSTVNSRDVAVDGTKLDGVEDNATADQTPAEIEAAYEGIVGNNKFTTAEKDKLALTEISTQLDTRDVTNRDVDNHTDGTTNGVYTLVERGKVANVPADTTAELLTKQDVLVNQVNIKSVNGETLVGSGDLTVAAGSGGYAADLYFSDVQSTINVSYKTLSYVPDLVSVVKQIVCNNGETAGETYLFELPIDTTVIDAGKWVSNFHCVVDSNTGDTRLRIEGFMRATGGIETTLFTSTSPELANVLQSVEWSSTEPVLNVDATSVYGIRVFASTSSNSDRTVSYTVGDGNASYTNTPVAIRHDQLRARDMENSHPIGAITGLQSELDSKLSLTAYELRVEW